MAIFPRRLFMQNKLISIFGMGVIMGILIFLSTQLCAQSLPKSASWMTSPISSSKITQSSTSSQAIPQSWELPQSTTVKDAGTRTYRFTIVYNSTDMRGEMLRRQRLTGDYTRGLPDNKVRWNNGTEEDADGATAPYGPPQPRDFMDGFTYVNNLGDSMKPDFFKGFPPTAVFERNLVWDTGMFEDFGQNFFQHLKLNGHDCAVISYQAFFNPLEINNGGMDMKGRSDYWGLIWVSLATRQIEYATLSETVTAELKLPGQNTIQNVNVLRTGDFQLIKK